MSLLPLPATIKPSDRVTKALAGLVTVGFAVERETNEPSGVHRADGDLRFGLFATESGLAAIGIVDKAETDAGDAVDQPTDLASAPAVPAKPTKKSEVLALLRRDGGATLPELIAATDWLPHTVRAAITGLRKAGHVVDRCKRGTDTCYQIAGAQ